MNAWKWTLVALGFLAIGGVMSESLGGSTSLGPRWSTNWKEAVRQARAQHKLLLVDFDGQACKPCALLKREVYSTKEFDEKTKDFILVELDVQKNMDFAQRSQVETIPDLRVVSPDGRIVGQEIGYGGPEEFYAFIDAAIRRAGK